MNLETMQIIKALKVNEGSIIWRVARVLDIPIRVLSITDLTRILCRTMQEYIECCDNPRAEMIRFLHSYTDSLLLSHDDYYRFASFLTLIQVRKDGKYINGFDERIEHCLDGIDFDKENNNE